MAYNSARRVIYHKPRYTEWEAYDLLPKIIKAALSDSVFDWCSYSVLKIYRKNGIKYTLAAIHLWEIRKMEKGLIPAKGRRKAYPSPYVECKVGPLKNYRLDTNNMLAIEVR